MKVKLYTPYTYEQSELDVGVVCPPDPDFPVQHSMAQECDINHIVSLYVRNGQLPLSSLPEGVYGDFSAITDYRSALEAVTQAESAFNSLDAKVRNRFSNDPQQFLEFCQNLGANRAEAEELGLIAKGSPAAPAAVTPPVADA